MSANEALLSSNLMVLAYIFLIPAVAFWLEKKYELFEKLNPCIFVIFVSMFLANIGIIPIENPVYTQISDLAVPLAIPMLLFSVNLKEWGKLAKSAILSFIIASVGVALVVLITGLTMDVGPEGWKVGGMLIGTYTGGSMNLAAIGTALNASSETYVVTNAADLVLFSLFIGGLFFLPPLLKDHYKTSIIGKETEEGEVEENFWDASSIDLYSISWLIAVPMVIVALSDYIAGFFPEGVTGAIFILSITTISLILAQFKKIQQNISGNDELGNYLLHMFFAAIGAQAYIPTILEAGPTIAIWVTIVILGAALFHFVFGKLFGIDLETIIITSNAAIGGPTTAVAMAISMKWKPMIVTGLITGLIGYSVGNYLGISIGHLLRTFRPEYFGYVLNFIL